MKLKSSSYNSSEENTKKSDGPDYDEDKEQLEEKQEKQIGETRITTNQVF